MFLYECSLVYFVIISTMSNECFNGWQAILLCIYLFMFMCFDSKNSYLWFILTYEQYYITHELIIFIPRDSLVSIVFSVVCDLDASESNTRGKNLHITLWPLLALFINLHLI